MSANSCIAPSIIGTHLPAAGESARRHPGSSSRLRATGAATADHLLVQLVHSGKRCVADSRRVGESHVGARRTVYRPLWLFRCAGFAGSREASPVVRPVRETTRPRWVVRRFRPERRRSFGRAEDVRQLRGVKAMQAGIGRRLIAMIEQDTDKRAVLARSALATSRSAVQPYSCRREAVAACSLPYARPDRASGNLPQGRRNDSRIASSYAADVNGTGGIRNRSDRISRC